MSHFTAEEVKKIVEGDLDRLLLPWMIGRPVNYTMDVATKHIVAAGFWLDNALAEICNDDDRRTQNWKFNRLSRTYDVWETAAECINEALDRKVEQNRVPHRRWG